MSTITLDTDKCVGCNRACVSVRSVMRTWQKRTRMEI